MPVDPTVLPHLSARSVLLSLMLGSHPGVMSSAALVRTGQHFGIPASTVRVALTRAVAAGDLHRTGTDYALGTRLVQRQQHQDEAVLDAETDWDGTWEMAVVVVSGRGGAERAALRDLLARHRLAELREGVWTRPANLRRDRGYADDVVLTTFTALPDTDPAALAADLWDLAGWADDGRTLLRMFGRAREPQVRLAVAAALVRQLANDPLLPTTLQPTGWPAGEMRATYADYQAELASLTLE